MPGSPGGHRAAGTEQTNPGLPGPGQIISEGDIMTTQTAVTMQDLELESAELLPSRETLWCCSGISGSFNKQVAILSGNNVASGNNVSVLSFGSSQSSNTSAVGNYIG
jgi:hypothetical protein